MNVAPLRPSLAFACLITSVCALASVAGCASGGDLGIDASASRRDGGDAAADAPTRTCTDDAECDDGNPCNGTETCAASTCAPGAPVDCSDSVACTTDACDPGTGACSNTPDDSTCSEGLVCDPVDDCSTPRPCEVDTDCDDAIFCNGEETCDPAFGCRRGDTPACDDGLACTSDACDATTDACVHAADDAVCDDGLPCNGAEVCAPDDTSADGDGCVIGDAPVCDDGVACTADVCVDAMGGCIAMPDDAACSNDTFCDGAERCDVTAGCTAGPPPTCEDGVGCTTGTCDATLDACVQMGDDGVCQDGAACNGRELCDATGSTPGMGCVAGAPMDCSDGAACTTDSCVEPGTCVHGGSDADGDGYTAVGCATGNDCNDLVPAVHPGATEICDGVDNDCSGGADDGTSMECALGSAPRACTTSCGSPGLQACNGTCRLGPCIGTAELCNDCDDDSDGIIDDGLTCRRGTSAACTTSCGTSGTRTCASDCSGYGACRAPGESCNDCDDDGNGMVDDGLPCRRGTSASCTTTCGTAGSRVCAVDCSGYGACRAPAEVCNACDDDGNGAADDGFACRQGQTQSCTTTCGTVGVRTCASDCSGYGACVATEVCNGCDDDGDGTADEGFLCTAGATQACTTMCGGAGVRTCSATCGGYGACTAIESCNGCDDDGDGTADEDFACRQGASTACVTSCGTSGTRTCASDCSGLGACSATEVCNGCDDDADGTPDDGFACRQGATQACTTTCGTPGTQTCNGTCTGFSTCAASADVCGNGCDDDGNGTADDGCAPPPPANDQCTGAIALATSGTSTTVTGTTVGATNQGACRSGGDVYYSFTLTQREIVYLDTFGSTYDTTVALASACTGNIACNDDSTCSGLQSQLVQVLAPGTYYVVVGGFSTTGAFTLHFQHLPAGNGTPVVLTRGAGRTVSGTTSGTGTTSSSSCGGSGPENAHYYVTCPSDAGGAFSASTCSGGASWDTVVYLRQASSGAEVCNDDGCSTQSTISGTIASGAGLRVLYVDGFGSAAGSYTLSYTVP